jgi:hypothetical protein
VGSKLLFNVIIFAVGTGLIVFKSQACGPECNGKTNEKKKRKGKEKKCKQELGNLKIGSIKNLQSMMFIHEELRRQNILTEHICKNKN